MRCEILADFDASGRFGHESKTRTYQLIPAFFQHIDLRFNFLYASIRGNDLVLSSYLCERKLSSWTFFSH